MSEDDKFRELLETWRTVEPASNFEANVWRRIRTAGAPGTMPDMLSWLWLRPVLAAASLALALGIGASAGTLIATPEKKEFPVQGTIAGAYAQMVKGVAR